MFEVDREISLSAGSRVRHKESKGLAVALRKASVTSHHITSHHVTSALMRRGWGQDDGEDVFGRSASQVLRQGVPCARGG